VTIRLPHSKFSIVGATVRHVGGSQQAVELRTCGDALCCSVALHRGCAALVLSTGRANPLKTDDTSPRVNNTRQLVLFLDDKQLSETTGDIALQVNNPIKHEEPVLRPTEPWENWGILFYQTVLFVAEDDAALVGLLAGGRNRSLTCIARKVINVFKKKTRPDGMAGGAVKGFSGFLGLGLDVVY